MFQPQFLSFLVSSVIGGNHTIYVSNTSSLSGNRTFVYNRETLPTEIQEKHVFRYLTYEARFQETNISIEICEIGIVGECLNKKKKHYLRISIHKQTLLVKESFIESK